MDAAWGASVRSMCLIYSSAIFSVFFCDSLKTKPLDLFTLYLSAAVLGVLECFWCFLLYFCRTSKFNWCLLNMKSKYFSLLVPVYVAHFIFDSDHVIKHFVLFFFNNQNSVLLFQQITLPGKGNKNRKYLYAVADMLVWSRAHEIYSHLTKNVALVTLNCS